MSDAQTIDRLLAALAQRLAPETPYDRALRQGRARMVRRHEYNLMLSWYRQHPIGTAVTVGAARERFFVASAPFEVSAPPGHLWMVRLSVDLTKDPAGKHDTECIAALRKATS